MAHTTELVFILDRSGSMVGLESDTIGGYNAMLRKQQAQDGEREGEREVKVTTALFDDTYVLLHDRADLKSVLPLTEKEYCVGGTTALLDAVGKTIRTVEQQLQNESQERRDGKVLFVITTDGLENASREYTCDGIKSLIERKKSESGWEFLFLGANIDAIATASRFGIDANRAANYCADGEGTRLNFTAVNTVVSSLRMGAPVPCDWKESIDADYVGRFLRKKRPETR